VKRTPHGYFDITDTRTASGRRAVVIAAVCLRAAFDGDQAWRWRCSTWRRDRDGAHRVRLLPLSTGTHARLEGAIAKALDAKSEQVRDAEG